jgi:hypothetical protein
MYPLLQLPDSSKFTQIGIFGMKKCHLATLITASSSHERTSFFLLVEKKNFFKSLE